MSTTLFTAWYDEVLPEVPGCPQPVALNAIRNAAIEFCRRSWVWRVSLDTMPVYAEVPDYELEPPTKTKVAKILQVWFQGREIYPKAPDELNRLYARWPAETGTPKWFVQRDPEILLLVPMPLTSIEDAVEAEVAIAPSRASTGIDSAIYEKYLDAITHGALARLFRSKSKPWTDTVLAADRTNQFDAAIGLAKVDAVKGHGRSRLRVKPYFF